MNGSSAYADYVSIPSSELALTHQAYRSASPAQKMAAVLIEDIDLQLIDLHRRAALMRSHLN
ncbi:hypothetical protein HA38_00505 [Pantoea allii]|nr:hypothetical protein A6A26_11750 [Pantoea sp. OXWO6B1]ORM88892.1 hypothetical protein HA38_00505 [Pantoea allii]